MMRNTSGSLNTKRKKKMLKDKPRSYASPKVKTAKKRLCLKCGKIFLSKGRYNRICEKCGMTNERIATNTYSVNGISTESTDTFKSKFFELN